jgi:hypothetical protein
MLTRDEYDGAEGLPQPQALAATRSTGGLAACLQGTSVNYEFVSVLADR